MNFDVESGDDTQANTESEGILKSLGDFLSWFSYPQSDSVNSEAARPDASSIATSLSSP